MTDLIDKLNVLLKANLNRFLGNSPEDSALRPGKITPGQLGRDVEKEIAALRKQIDEALTAEDSMQTRLDDYQRQIDQYGQQADEALKRQDEAQARLLLQQARRQEQLATMLRAELDQHRRATSEFIERVNMLDAMVAEARHEKEQTDPAQNALDSVGEKLSDLIRGVRERVEDITTSVSTSNTEATPGQPVKLRTEDAPPPEPGTSVKINISPSSTTPPEKKDDGDDDDIAARRSRLSKP